VTARKSLLGKALDRPADVRKVLEKARSDGIVAAYRAASDRLETPIPLGYSAAGTVVAVGRGVEDLIAGDRVACAGQGYASHAEWISVPRNLCAKIPADENRPLGFESAAFATVGAIALHAVRQAEAKLGESIAVVGLGLMGHLTARLSKAAGCRVIGIEPNAFRRELGGVDVVCAPHEAEERVRQATGGIGADAVIVTASSSDPQFLESVTHLCRDRGRLVILGGVPMQLPRDLVYAREIEVRVSRSYGPGRYDPSYEERGIDYPIGYVRWTERRNLEAFLQLAADDRLDLAALVTHRFPIEAAAQAYDLLVDADAPALGILIDYPAASSAETTPPARDMRLRPARDGRFGVAFLGAGNFAQAALLPAVRAEKDVVLRAVATRRGLTARLAAERFDAERAATDTEAVLRDPSIDVVFVTGPNSTHAPQTIAALGAGKHVFTEKPLCLRAEELDHIERALAAAPTAALMVGFNRRFAPATKIVRDHFASAGGPQIVSIRVNSGPSAATGWASDRETEGGLILGEACHFVDLLAFLFDSTPVRVQASRPSFAPSSPDDVVATLEFAGGQVGSIVYLTSGSAKLAKERIELFGGGRSAVIDDFRSVTVFDRRARRHGSRWSARDKGHRAEVAAFFASLRTGTPPPTPFPGLAATMRATIAVEESLRLGTPIDLRRV